MHRIISPLEPGMQSPAVSDLQTAPQQLLSRAILPGDRDEQLKLAEILRQEEANQTYGDITAKVVTLFQEERYLDPRGSVDEPTAKAKMGQQHSEDEMLAAIGQSHQQSFAKQQALREEMIVKMATPEITADIERHTLSPFARLLEPNPRAMKRLVNAYSVNRALSTLGHLDIPKQQLVLWTILAMRWPKLAEHLEEHPEDIQRVGRQGQSSSNGSIGDLFDDVEVKHIVQGGGVAAALDAKTVAQCALLRM